MEFQKILKLKISTSAKGNAMEYIFNSEALNPDLPLCSTVAVFHLLIEHDSPNAYFLELI